MSLGRGPTEPGTSGMRRIVPWGIAGCDIANLSLGGADRSPGPPPGSEARPGSRAGRSSLGSEADGQAEGEQDAERELEPAGLAERGDQPRA